MANTATALISRKQGSSLAVVSSQLDVRNLDILQIVDEGGGVLLNVDYAGVVHNPAVNPTVNSQKAPYQTRLTSGATTARLFAEAFSNPSQLDILQVINIGGNISYYLDYLGVAHGA
jgi:ABC-type tungstate transport system permease subunit